MAQPWIHKKWTDTIFILLPSFIVVLGAVLFQNSITNVHDFYFWLLVVVFIDVAHVYSTLFKTYFRTEEFQKNKTLYMFTPIICFIISVILYQFGEIVFWRILAYVAVYHFVRQQYGFFRVYSRFENESNLEKWIGNLAIYAATLYPICFWFFGPKRSFNWFIDGDFLLFQSPILVQTSLYIYIFIQILFVLFIVKKYLKTKSFNFPRIMIWMGTVISWYVGIIVYNNDMVFSLLNIVSHGIPYMALIFFNSVSPNSSWKSSLTIKTFVFIIILMTLGFIEEYIWDIAVWNEHFDTNLFFDFSPFLWFIVPLLTVPQFTHYVLDGFIWKTKRD